MSDNLLYDLIRQGESGPERYNAFNRGTHRGLIEGKIKDIPNLIGPIRHEPITSLTLDQIRARQSLPTSDPTRLGAIGQYQIIATTLEVAIDKLKLQGDAKADEPLQDRIFAGTLLKDVPAVAGYIQGKTGVTLHDAQYGLAGQWAAFSDPTQGDLISYYEGPANHASVSLGAAAQALGTLRTRYADAYRTAVAGHDGDPERTAWTAATAIQPEQRARWERIQGPAARAGDAGPAVAELQGQLNRAAGGPAAPLGVTGTFDAATHDAVLAFQHAHGLAADGVAGPKTRLALAEATGDILAARPAAGAHAPSPVAPATVPSAPLEVAAARNPSSVPHHPAEAGAPVQATVAASGPERHPAEAGPAAPVETVAARSRWLSSPQRPAEPAAHAVGSAAASNPWRRIIETSEAAPARPAAEDAGARRWREIARQARADHEPELAQGARGASVQALQRGLDAAGARDRDGRPLHVDGVFGARTAEAVRDFQEARGLAADGVAGRNTHAALTSAASSASTAATPAQNQGVRLRQ